MASQASRDVSWLFESLGLSDEVESKRPRIAIPESVLFRRDNATGSLAPASWLVTGKHGTVVRKPPSELLGNLRKWREKLSAGSVPGQPIAQAFGFDGIGQGVPPAGLDNLLSDLESGTLEGIIMLQAKAKLGPKPAGHFEVEITTEAPGKDGAPGKPLLKARIAHNELVNAAAGAALRTLRDDLLSLGKRVTMAVEANRRVRLVSATIEVVADSAAQPVLYLVGATAIRTTLNDIERGAPTAVRASSAGAFDAMADLVAGATGPVRGRAGEPAILTGGSVLDANGNLLYEGAAPGSLHAGPSLPSVLNSNGELETTYLDGGPSSLMQARAVEQQQGAWGMPLLSGGVGAPPFFPGSLPPVGSYVQGGYVGPMALASPMDGGQFLFSNGGPVAAPAPAHSQSPPRERPRSISPYDERQRMASPRQGGSRGSPTRRPASVAMPAGGEDAAVLRQQVADLKSKLALLQLAEGASQPSSAPTRGEPAEIAELRAAGRFKYVEEALPAAEDGPEALAEVVRRLQARCAESVSLAETVRGVYAREASEAVSRLVADQRREMLTIAATYDVMEDSVATTNARLNAAGLELAAAARREQAALDRGNRILGENRRLAVELQSVMAAGSRLYSAQPQPPSAVGPPSRRTSAVGPDKRSNALRAGAEILGMGSGSGSASSAMAVSFAAAGGAAFDDATLLPAQDSVALANMAAALRSMQLELEAAREIAAAEATSRVEFAEANSKLIDEFRHERSRLKARVTQLEDTERVRASTTAALSPLAAPGPELTSPTKAGVVPSGGMHELLAKVRGMEDLQEQLTEAQRALAKATEAREAEAAARADAARQLAAVGPLVMSFEAEATALRTEVSALRSSSGPGKSEAGSASDRALAARALADAELARGEVKALREALDRARAESTRKGEQLARLKESWQAEVDFVRQAGQAERDRVILDMSAAHERATKAAVDSVQSEALKKYNISTGKLQQEVMALSVRVQGAAGAEARLKAQLAKAKDAAASAAAAPAAEVRPKPGTAPTRDLIVDGLRTEIAGLQEQCGHLSGELLAVRDRSARQAFELSQEANARLSALHAEHIADAARLDKEAKAALSAAVRKAVAESSASVQAGAAKAVEAAEAESASIIAAADERLRTTLIAFEEESTRKTKAAVLSAVESAQRDWEAKMAAAAAITATEQKSAADFAERAHRDIDAARYESAQLSEMLRSLQVQAYQLDQTLTMERSTFVQTQAQLVAREAAFAQLASDMRAHEEEMQQVMRASAEAAEERQLTSIINMDNAAAAERSAAAAERSTAIAAAVGAEIERNRVATARAEAVHRAAMEMALAEAEVKLREESKAALEEQSKDYTAKLAKLKESAATALASAAPKPGHTSTRDLIVDGLRAEIAGLLERCGNLSGELLSVRDLAARHAYELSQEANARLSAMHAEHIAATTRAEEETKAAFAAAVRNAVAESSASAQVGAAKAIAAAEASIAEARRAGQSECASITAAADERLRTTLLAFEKESARKTKAAVLSAVQAAQVDWEAKSAASAANAATEQNSAADFAERAHRDIDAARYESAQLSEMLRSLQVQAYQLDETLTTERGTLAQTQAQLAAREAAFAQLASDMRAHEEKMQQVMRASAEAAEERLRTSIINMNSAAAAELSAAAAERSTAIAAAVGAEIERNRVATARAEAVHQAAMEMALAEAEVKLREESKAALEEQSKDYTAKLASATAAPKPGHTSTRDLIVDGLRAEIAGLLEQCGNLSGELLSVRDLAARHAYELSQEANARLSAMHAEHIAATTRAEEETKAAFAAAVRNAVAESSASAQVGAAKAIAAAEASVAEARRAGQSECASITAAADERLRTTLLAFEEESARKTKAAVLSAVEAAQVDWEVRLAAVIATEQKNAADFAERAHRDIDAARYESAQLSEMLRSLQVQAYQLDQTLTTEHGTLAQTQAQLAAREAAFAQLASDMRARDEEMEQVMRASAEAAEERLRTSLAAAVSAAAAERSAAVAAAVSAEVERSRSAALRAEDIHQAAMEMALAEAEVKLREESKVALEAQAKAAQAAAATKLTSAVAAAASESEAKSSEETARVWEGRLAAARAQAEMEVRGLQAQMMQMDTALQQTVQAYNAATENASSLHAEAQRVISELEARFSVSKAEADTAASTSLAAARATAEKDFEAAHARARQEMDAAIAAAIAATEAAVRAQAEASLSSAREVWKGELTTAVNSATSELRQQYDAEILRLRSSMTATENRVALTFKEAEEQYAVHLAATRAAHAEEVQRVLESLAATQAAVTEERAKATNTIDSVVSSGGMRLAEARQEVAALKARIAEVEAAKEAEGKAAVAALASALASAAASFEAERAAFQKSSEAAAEAIIAEANTLVSRAAEEAARAHAAAGQTAEGKAAVEAALARSQADIAALVSQRDALVAAAEERHQGTVNEATGLMSRLQEALRTTEARVLQAQDAGMAAVAEVSARLGLEADDRLRQYESAWAQRAAVLQADNEKAAGIITGLLHETDEASLRANAAAAALVAAQEDHAKQMDENNAAVTAALERNLEQASEAALTEQKRLMDVHAAQAAAWGAERAELEDRFAQQRVAQFNLMGMAQAQEGAVKSVVDDMIARHAEEMAGLKAEASAEADALRGAHSKELGALLAEQQAALSRLTSSLVGAKAAAIATARAEATAAADTRIAALESVVAHEMSEATRASTTSNAAAVSALMASHAEEVAALRADSSSKLAAATTAAEQERSALAQQFASMQVAFSAEIQGLRDSSVPVMVVQELRNQMEAQAVAALTSAVEDAVGAARRESDQLEAVLRQRIEDQDADRKLLSRQLDMLQEAVTAQMATSAQDVAAAQARAEDAERAVEEARAEIAIKTAEVAGSLTAAAVAEAEAAMMERLRATQESMQAELTRRGEEMAAAAAAQAAVFSQARESLLSEKAALETAMTSLQGATVEAVTERDMRFSTLTNAYAALQGDLEQARGPATEALKLAMREAFDAERTAMETRAVMAVEQGIAEAVAAGEAAKAAALEVMRARYERQFMEFEEESRRLTAALLDALETKHREEMEAANRSALANRDEALALLMSDRNSSLKDAQSVAQTMLDAAGAEHESTVANLRAVQNEEKAALVAAHRAELMAALEAAREEMRRLLGEADAAWREKAAGMLAAAAEEQARAVAALQALYAGKLARFAEAYEGSCMAAEEARQAALADAVEGIASAVASARAAGEADKIATLGSFNAEWVSRMQARVGELLEEREAELVSVRAQYQAQVDETVARLEAQRASAMAAFAAEAEAERARLIDEKLRAVAEATAIERAAGEHAIAVALARAREELESALAEQAAALAEERARAIDAVRQQAAEEQEEAMDALRSESEKLLMSIEGAMTRLRDERDVAQEDLAVAKETLAAERAHTASLEEIIRNLRRAAVVARLASIKQMTIFACVLQSTKDRMAAEAAAALEALRQEASARIAAANAIANEFRAKFRILVKMRAVMQETLTSFKREQLVGHRVKSTQLSQELVTLSEEKSAMLKQAAFHGAAVAEVEGTVRAIEREMSELSKQSVIDPDGTVNVALTRKKKRLDRDMDAALVKISDRKTAQTDVDKKVSRVEEERSKKEEELKSVEAGLVATMVTQQRAIMSVVTGLPLAPEDLELTREEAVELGLSDPDDVEPGEEEDEEGEGASDPVQGSSPDGEGPGPYDEAAQQAAGAAQQQAVAAAMHGAALAQAQQQLAQLQAMATTGQLGAQGAAVMQQVQMQVAALSQQAWAAQQQRDSAGAPPAEPRSTSPGRSVFWGQQQQQAQALPPVNTGKSGGAPPTLPPSRQPTPLGPAPSKTSARRK